VVPLGETVRSVRVRTLRQRPAQKFAQVYAVSLEGEGGGLLYHSYGIVGATAETFTGSPALPHLLSGLQPNLVVVTLGTNDARRMPLDEGRLRGGFGDLVRMIRSLAPQAGIVLTSPPASMRRMTRRGPFVADPGVDLVRRIQLELAASLQVGTWDLYAIMGGAGSISAWKGRQLAASDLVHFTKDGYTLQGSLFAAALLAGLDQHADR
jgi:lysophospholipase L1-like esterase